MHPQGSDLLPITMTFSVTNLLLQNAATRQARVLLVGSGRMGNIRAKALYSSPKYDFVGVVDSNVDEAAKLGGMYRVSIVCYHHVFSLFIQFLISLQYFFHISLQ